MRAPDPSFWRDRRVLVVGHTGFTGTWLALWLEQLGAQVTGMARRRPEAPALHAVARADEGVRHLDGDVRDPAAIRRALDASGAEVVFHMAAQPLVGTSLDAPADTYAVNVMGTVNVLDALRDAGTVRACVVASSQDVYADQGTVWAYRENDPLGGRNPYAGAKACAELVTNAMRLSFLTEAGVNVATARAGNLVGGGDWSADRLVPDAMRAAAGGGSLTVRDPEAIRPWQYVLDGLRGYLLLAERLVDEPACATAFNLGPPHAASVRDVIERLEELCDRALADLPPRVGSAPASAFRLDSSRAENVLGWRAAWSLDEALRAAVAWYRSYDRGDDMRAFTLQQIAEYSPTLAAR